MARVPNIRVRGIRQKLPSNYLIGRRSAGDGPAELVDMRKLAAGVIATGMVAPAGPTTLAAIANNRVLANVSGATAQPTATALTQPAAGFTITGGSSAFTFALANDLLALEGLGSTGLAVRTAADTWAQRSLAAPAAGLTIANNDGVSGNPTFALADDLAALEAMSGTGIVARTAANTYAQRTLTAPAAGITVSNGDGVAGNPTLVLANDLAAVEGLAGTGIAVRTGSDAWTNRTVVAGSAKITVSNGSGAAGNPSIDLGSVAAADLSNGVTGSGAIVLETGATVSGLILTGNTTLPGSGRLDSTGRLGLFATPNAPLHVGGAVSDLQIVQVNATQSNANTGTQFALNIQPTFTPGGASLSNLYAQLFSPTINSFSGTLSNFIGISVQLKTGASHSGSITNGASFNAFTPDFGGSTPINTYAAFNTVAITNGNALSAGSVNNRGLAIGAISAGAAGGTLNNYGAFINVPSGGASSGSAVNRGLYLTGNGGTASGGTVTNHAIYNDSTARNYFAGQLSVGTTTDPGAGNLLVSSTVKAGGFTVATLPAAGTAGRRTYVTNANATTFASVVAGGGANVVPVFDNGTNWIIG